jgi:hypothetical protein
MNFAKTLTVVGVALSSAVVFANPVAPVVKERQDNQTTRIQDGVVGGELTKKETAVLRAEQRAIRAEKRAFKADGKLSKAERAHLRREQNEASRHIYNKKHNDKKPA